VCVNEKKHVMLGLGDVWDHHLSPLNFHLVFWSILEEKPASIFLYRREGLKYQGG